MKQSSKKPSSRDPMLISLKKLQQNIQKSEQKNLTKYSEIKRICPTFEYPLYKAMMPMFSYQNRQQLSIAQKCMLKQIDKLMEDQQKLSIQWSRQSVKVKEYQKIVEKQLMSNMDHFTFLRKIWKRDVGIQQQQKVDKLIHNVGAIKGHILNLIKRENNLIQSAPQLHQLITSSPQYCHLLKQNELLKQQLNQRQEQAYWNPNANTNSNTITSLSSIESNGTGDSHKQGQQQKYEQLEKSINILKNQLQQKNRQILVLKAQAKKQLTNGMTTPSKSLQKTNFIAQIEGSDGFYELTIRKLEVSNSNDGNGSISDESTSPSSSNRQMRTKRKLQQIIRFIQSTNEGRISRTSVSKPLEEEGKRFSVQEITRAKFISNRQMSGSNSNGIGNGSSSNGIGSGSSSNGIGVIKNGKMDKYGDGSIKVNDNICS